jgi:Holliday junction resolvase RusA-like endonuclease
VRDVPEAGGVVIAFIAYGLPVPQGSTRAFVVNGRAVTTSANKNLRPWRDTVAAAARDATETTLSGPVVVLATFTLPRPSARPKKDRWPDRRPDLDKLLRGLLDGITGPTVTDDAQIVGVTCWKRYVGDPVALVEPGVQVVLEVAG